MLGESPPDFWFSDGHLTGRSSSNRACRIGCAQSCYFIRGRCVYRCSSWLSKTRHAGVHHPLASWQGDANLAVWLSATGCSEENRRGSWPAFSWFHGTAMKWKMLCWFPRVETKNAPLYITHSMLCVCVFLCRTFVLHAIRSFPYTHTERCVLCYSLT